MATKRITHAAFSDKEYKAIPMTPVQSNQIGAVGYDDMMAAESKGSFFGQHIKALAFDKFPAPEKAA